MNTLHVFALCVATVFLVGCQDRATSQSGGTTSPGAIATRGAATPSTADTTGTSPMTTDKTAATNADAPAKVEEAMFGAGCFWGVEMTFANTPGVLTTAVGYAGGTTQNPMYKEVCNGDTGHVEVVHLTYDPTKLTYYELLAVFFANHDPTQVNRQGPDYGTQYRTVVFAYGSDQMTQAQAAKKMLDESGKFRRPIATKIEPAPTFWKAEEYHQQYLKKRGLENCHIPGN